MHRVLRTADTLFRYGFGVIILALLVLYLWGAFFTREVGLEKYEKEFLAATLFWLVGFALTQTASLASVNRTLDRTRVEMSVLARASAAANAAPEVRFYEGEQVYEATRQAVAQARSRVWVTYLRDEGPRRASTAAQHFEACRRWAVGSAGRSFRRIILHANKPMMNGFYARELETFREATALGRSYQVKLLKGSTHSLDAFSVGLYDDLVVLMHSEGPENAFAVSIKGDELALHKIREYFNRLWNLESARPIREIFPGSALLDGLTADQSNQR